VPVDAHHDRAQCAAVEGVDPLDAGLAHLAVGGGQGHHRRPQRGHQVVQERLVTRVADHRAPLVCFAACVDIRRRPMDITGVVGRFQSLIAERRTGSTGGGPASSPGLRRRWRGGADDRPPRHARERRPRGPRLAADRLERAAPPSGPQSGHARAGAARHRRAGLPTQPQRPVAAHRGVAADRAAGRPRADPVRRGAGPVPARPGRGLARARLPAAGLRPAVPGRRAVRLPRPADHHDRRRVRAHQHPPERPAARLPRRTGHPGGLVRSALGRRGRPPLGRRRRRGGHPPGRRPPGGPGAPPDRVPRLAHRLGRR